MALWGWLVSTIYAFAVSSDHSTTPAIGITALLGIFAAPAWTVNLALRVLRRKGSLSPDAPIQAWTRQVVEATAIVLVGLALSGLAYSEQFIEAEHRDYRGFVVFGTLTLGWAGSLLVRFFATLGIVPDEGDDPGDDEWSEDEEEEDSEDPSATTTRSPRSPEFR